MVKYDTELTISKERLSIYDGEVTSEVRKCMEGRRVVLFELRPGADLRLGTDRSEFRPELGEGVWEVVVHRAKRRAYAKVRRKEGDGFVCRAARSRTIPPPRSLGVRALGAQTAAAPVQELSCGDTITADTTLHKDLVDCPSNGIVIGADNVTLDLNGHTIDGNGTVNNQPSPVPFVDTGVGVFIHEGITVKDGSIRQFGTAFDAFGSRQIRLLDVATSGNQRFGITLSADDRILVRNCSVNHTTDRGRGPSFGLLVTQGGGPVIGGLHSSHHVRIVNSSFRDNAGDGIGSFHTTDSVIEGNLVSGNGATGIAWGGNRSRLMRNRIIRDENGIVVDGTRNVIARNRVSHIRRDGVGVEISPGVSAARGNLLAGNVVAGGATSIRINGELEPGRGGPVDTVVRGNRLLRANRDGVFVALTAKHTLLRHNSARHSQGDGFDVNDRSTKLSRNRAVRNHDLGIEAVRGVNDGGGNIARRNGDPRQCTHIVCR